MGDQDLGLKAPGMCLEPLLAAGIPSNCTLECMLRDIDAQLQDNQARMEESVKELMQMSQNLSGSQDKFLHPSTALMYITENRLLDKEMCYDPDSEAVNKLLRSVLQIIDKNPGCEEKVLAQLFEISASEGLALPYRESGDPVSQSVISINAATDSSEQATEKLWNDICLKMKKYYSDKLRNIPIGQKKQKICVNEQLSLRYVRGLCSLMAPGKVWTLYSNIRQKQLEACIKRHIPGLPAKSKKSGPVTDTVVHQFCSLSQVLLLMLDEDFNLVNSGVFSNVVTPMTALTEVYGDPLTEQVSLIVDYILEDLVNSPASSKSPRRDSKRSKEEKEMSKSPSDVGFLGHLKVSMANKQSKSADNLLNQDEDQQFSDIQVLPGGFLEPLTKLVEGLLVIEEHMDRLNRAMVWETMGTIGSKTKVKPNLKSALKSTQVLDAEDKKNLFSPRSFEKSGLLPEAIPSPFGASQAMMAQLSASLKVVEKPFSEHIHWSWRKSFGKLAPDLARSVEYHVYSQCEQSLHDLDTHWQALGNLAMVPVPLQLAGGRLDYPQKMSQPLLSLMTELDKLLPLTQAGLEGPFVLVRAAFIDAVIANLKKVRILLCKMTSEGDQLVTEGLLLEVLSCLAYIRNQLLFYENTLPTDDNGHKVFPVLYKQFCDITETHSKHLIQKEMSLMVTSILHDAESNFWEDSKDFYENERCSFTIHMWYSHLQCLRDDLWSICPPRLARSTFTTVLQESLSLLCQRYGHVKPSYRRTQQFRTDVTAILLCVSELLYYTTDSVATYLDPTSAHREHFGIHASCSMLLATMTVVTAPIDTIYKVFKKGFKKKRSHSDEDSTRGYVSHWLSWLRPQLFPMGKTSVHDLQTTAALFVHLKILQSQPDPSWPLLLQVLLMKDYSLSIMLLTQLALTHTTPTTPPTDIPQPPKPRGKDSERHRKSREEPEPSGDSRLLGVFRTFTKFLVQCSQFPFALTKVLMPVLERTGSWSMFDAEVVISRREQISPWLAAILDCMDDHIVRWLNPGVRVLMKRYNEHVGSEPISLWLKELPCGCPTSGESLNPAGSKVLSSTSDVVNSVTQNWPDFKGSKDVLAEALYSIITQLTDDVFTLPSPLICFFKSAQQQLSQQGIHGNHSSPGIKMVATALKLRLSDMEYIEALLGEPLDRNLQENLVILGECVYHVLTAESYGHGSPTPQLAGMFIKANRNWVADQVDILNEHFRDELYEVEDCHPLEGCTVEFIENLLMAQISDIFANPDGEVCLQRLYHLIQNNMTWITSHLDIPPLLASVDPAPPTGQPGGPQADMEPHPSADFNVLKAYSKLGEEPFVQKSVVEFPWDWSILAHSDLGLSETNFRTLLFHRHEMQDQAYLEEGEKKPVESLRRRFHADSSDT